MHPNLTGRRFQRTLRPALLVALLVLLFPLLGAAQDSPRTLIPIGGGYSDETLEGFSSVVADQASGETVDIYVVPSTYGDDPADRDDNIELAGERTQQVEDACNRVSEIMCEATLLLLFDRADAEDPANSDVLYEEETDGVFILGGDQTIAMQVLANTPAEEALTYAYENGVVIGGTSAGAAMQSQDMLAGYTQPGWPYNALERPMIVVWWFNDGDDERGLVLGSEDIIWDQHFYQRGRFTRLLNVVAQSDEQYGGASKLGVGVDNATAITLDNETLLHNVFGETSATIVDAETSDTTFEWVGEQETLSARNLRTHVMPAGDQFSYDVSTRTPYLDGNALPLDAQTWDSKLLHAPRKNATLILGGDLTYVWTGEAMAEFLAQASSGGPILIVSADSDAAIGQNLINTYTNGLRAAGWSGEITSLNHADPNQWRGPVNQQLRNAGGVLFIARDQSRLDAVVNDGRFRGFMNQALNTTPVVMTDWAMTAIMGDWYVANPDPAPGSDRQARAIDAFRAGDANIQRGLGILKGVAIQPKNTLDQHWGRLYALSMAQPDTLVLGLSEDTAMLLQWKTDAQVIGGRSVIALDGQAATYAVGDNGAFAAFNVMLDAFAPGEAITPAR